MTLASAASGSAELIQHPTEGGIPCLRHPAVFITKGLPPPGPLLIHTLFD